MLAGDALMPHTSGNSSAGRRSLALADWYRGSVRVVRRVLGEAVTPLTRLVELPGRGTTRTWECPGPRRAETLMLIHGVAVNAELNWGKVLATVARHFRVIAADLARRGGGLSAGVRVRPESG